MSQEDEFKGAGAALRQLREAQGKSQEDIAFEVGFDQSSYSKVERLGPQVVSWAKLMKIAGALGCSIQITFKPRSGG